MLFKTAFEKEQRSSRGRVVHCLFVSLSNSKKVGEISFVPLFPPSSFKLRQIALVLEELKFSLF